MKTILWLDNEDYREKVEQWMKSNEEYVNSDKVTIKEFEWLKRWQIRAQEEHKTMLFYFPDIELKVNCYENPGYFSYTSFTFYKDGKEIGSFIRNYSPTSFRFYQHSNGKRYFVGGFNYQGYTVINLDDEVMNHYLPQSAMKGNGWCPTEWKSYSPIDNELDVEGCYWGGSYDIRTYDFSNPDVLPLKLLRECDAETGDQYADDDEEEENEDE